MQEIKLKTQANKKKTSIETYARLCTIKALMKSTGFEFKTQFASTQEETTYREEYDEVFSACESSLYTA